jgi:Domain of unknown function (DUF4276)
MTLYIAPVVEGHTEAKCAEHLLQSIWTKLLGRTERMQVLCPYRGNRDALVHPDRTDLADKIKEAYADLSRRLRNDSSGRGLLLLLLDAEEDCPARLAPRLLERARTARSDADIACVLAKRELENWFKAAAASLAGIGGLPNDLAIPANPEEGDGGAWLTRQMRRQNRGRKYTKPADAIELARRMDLQQCRDHSPSFDKLCRELEGRAPQPPRTDALGVT